MYRSIKSGFHSRWTLVGILALVLVASYWLIVDPNDPTDCDNYDDYVEISQDYDRPAPGGPQGSIVCP